MRKQESHMMNVELLINKVRENKAIYDASEKNHSNRNFIAYVWRKIGEELSMPEALTKNVETSRQPEFLRFTKDNL
ncbi:hypothetical protein TNCT_3691 [Trichonephila clavata]|uniref:MADF domain-containing protein n=1 Tax=Trichonephila clavata TaxID=2740835 RepID=A0A8X6KB63_TRICU|nr:hypothetical protein TNCT_3691 [Trichonephila clavata]